MKMPCNGNRPAYNVQYVSTTTGKAIIAVNVVNEGTDKHQMISMMEQVEKRCGVMPKEWLVDNGYFYCEALNLAEKNYKNSKVYMPASIDKKTKKEVFTRKPNDSFAVGNWRERMGTEEAKTIYKDRSSTAELVNAQSRNRGLQQFMVRGINKVNCVALLYAITQNMTLVTGT